MASNVNDFETSLINSKKLFQNLRGHYILSVEEINETSKIFGSMILEKIWKLHRISNIILTFPCAKLNEKVNCINLTTMDFNQF